MIFTGNTNTFDVSIIQHVMKITLEVADQKADFFLELLKSFQDFVRVEKQEDFSTPDWHLAELEKRLSAYKQNPQQTEAWEDVEKELERL